MSDYADGFDVRSLAATFRTGALVGLHQHRWGLLVFASSGIMRVGTDEAVWLITPTRAIWLPAGLRHSISISGEVAMLTLYIAERRATPLPSAPTVLEIVPLLRGLILHILRIGMLARHRDPADCRHLVRSLNGTALGNLDIAGKDGAPKASDGRHGTYKGSD